MANQAFRDVNTVVIFGTATTGVETVRLGDEADELNYNSDANQYRQDVGITRQVVRTEISKKSSAKLRDLLSAVFTAVGGDNTGTATLGRVQRARITQGSQELLDSGDADSWIRYAGVTDINGRAEITFRDKAQLHAAPLVKGRKGTLVVTVPIPREGHGLPAGTATETHTVLCMVKEVEDQAEHGALGEARVVFEMYGTTDPWSVSGGSGGAKLKQVAVGDEGTISWVSPAADAGSGEAVSVANGVCVGIDVELAHGEFAKSTIRATHYSSDGSSTPIS